MSKYNHRHPEEKESRRAGDNVFCRHNLDVGRVLITYPRYGRLDVYERRNKSIGATFVCEEDGGYYGVTAGVKKRFPDVGSQSGWGYISASQTVVFKFLLGDLSNVPENIAVIKTSDGSVDFPEPHRNGDGYADSSIVAFYSRFVGRNTTSPARRVATYIFPVDAGHPLLLTRLISGGRLIFPDYTEVLEMFFDALSNINNEFASQNRVQLDSALATLAANSEVPAQFQQLARVEQTKIASARIEQVNAPLLQHRGTITEEQKNTKIKPTSQTPAKDTVIGDVVQVKLQLD